MADSDQILKELLEKIAAEHGYQNCNTKLQSFSTEGANYTSQLYNITLTAPGRNDLKLFAKVASVNEEVRLQSPFNMFETEMFFYTDLLKRYQDLEEKHKVPEEHRLATVKFYGCKKEYLKEILVFEDVTSKGFKTFKRNELIDWEYASTAIRELAKFHALSIALHKERPLEFEDITKKFTLDKKKLEGMKPMMDATTKMLLEIVREENKDRIRDFMKKAQDYPVDHFNRPMHQAVIAHGDFRTSNFMHRERGDGKLELVVLDYQILNVSNSVIDLMYLIFSGSDEEFRGKHYHQLLDYYHAELSVALSRLGVDPLTTYPKEAFDSDVKEIEPYGLIVSMMTVPLMTVSAEDAPNLESGSFSDILVRPGSVAVHRINGIVNDYIKLGVL